MELNHDLVEKNICLINAMKKKKPIELVWSFYRLHTVNVMAPTGLEILIEKNDKV